MNGMTPTRVYLILLMAFILALGVGSFYFFRGMHATSYMVSNGVSYTLQYLDQPRHDRNLVGFIYSVVFLISGLLFLFIVIVPDERSLAGFRRVPPPQPRRRAPAPPRREAVTAPTPAPAPLAVAPEPPPVEPAMVVAPAAPKEPEVPVDEAAKKDVVEPQPAVDLPTLAAPEMTGEEDVVYGSGPVTEDSIFEFIQNHPDSAVKFLYRKNLDNRALSPMDEDIYQKWERRGMSRAKVREFVLELMDWSKLPDDFPHNIWRELRDQIFELKSRAK